MNTDPLTGFRNVIHNLLAGLGLLLALQGPIVDYVTGLGAPQKIIGAVFSGLGILAMLGSKSIDSQAYQTGITDGQVPLPELRIGDNAPVATPPPPDAAA